VAWRKNINKNIENVVRGDSKLKDNRMKEKQE
jgi:hypothetical protein